MARFAAAGLALLLWLCTGCFVFDEIDQGRDLMKKHSGANPEAKRAPEPAAEAEEEADGEGLGLLARVQRFVEDVRQPAEPERPSGDEIVRCDLEDGLTYTYESDCLSRGGTPH
jgi:hypothetical protein